MKVAIAAQTLSNSVAAGIMYLKNLKLKQFENSEETAKFVLKINNIPKANLARITRAQSL